MNKEIAAGLLALCLSIFTVPYTAIADPTVDQTYEISDLTATSGKGFGDYLNKYAWSMAYFKGHLYVGTWNITTLGVPSLINGGAEIWRLEDEDSARWIKVLDMGEGPIDDRMNMGFREMKEYNGKLYVGSFNIVQKESSLWESEDGFTWAKLKTFESDSIRAMAVYDNKLFFSTTSEFGRNGSGAGLWYFDGKDFMSVYSNKMTGGFGAIYVFKGNLYFTEWSNTNPLTMTALSPLPPQRLFKYDGKKVESVLELYDGQWMITLEEFGGYLYIGTNGFFGGGVPQSFNLRRSATPDDPDSWETIVGEGGIYPAGFDYRDNYYAWSLEKYNGKLYLGTLMLLGPSQLWVSDDGIHWTLIFEPESPMQYGIRELVATNEALYIGTAYNVLSPQLRNAGLQVFKLVSHDMGGEHTNLNFDENGIQYGIGYAGNIKKATVQAEELQK